MINYWYILKDGGWYFPTEKGLYVFIKDGDTMHSSILKPNAELPHYWKPATTEYRLLFAAIFKTKRFTTGADWRKSDLKAYINDEGEVTVKVLK